jgi:hypothetical protein
MVAPDAPAITQLKEAAEIAWAARWQFSWQMDADSIISISNALHSIGWIFFAPGDFILLETMLHPTRLALFFNISPDDLSGFGSGTLSFLWWVGLVWLGRK